MHMLAGVVFGVIVVAALLYLVPALLLRTPDAVEEESVRRVGEAVKVVRRDDDIDPSLDVSTPQTRRVDLFDLQRAEEQAARRRRHVLMVLVMVTAATGLAANFTPVPWFVMGVPILVMMAFLVTARRSVEVMQARHAAIAARIQRGNDEDTVAIRVSEVATPHKPQLWDPVPIREGSGPSQPSARRTVRTVSLGERPVESAMELSSEAVRDAAYLAREASRPGQADERAAGE